MTKLTIPQNYLPSLTDFGGSRLIIAQISLTSLYYGLPSFNMNVRPMSIELSLKKNSICEVKSEFYQCIEKIC